MRLARLGRIYGRFWQSGDFFRFLDYLALQRITFLCDGGGTQITMLHMLMLQRLLCMRHLRRAASLQDEAVCRVMVCLGLEM